MISVPLINQDYDYIAPVAPNTAKSITYGITPVCLFVSRKAFVAARVCCLRNSTREYWSKSIQLFASGLYHAGRPIFEVVYDPDSIGLSEPHLLWSRFNKLINEELRCIWA